MARWSPRVFEPPPESKEFWEVMMEVAARMNGAKLEALDELLFAGMLATFVGKPGAPCEHVTLEQARAKLGAKRGPERLLNLMLRAGPYGDGFDDAGEGLSLAKVRKTPHAIDLGALEPRLPEVLRTESRRLNLVHEILEKDTERLHRELVARRDENRMLLVGRRQIQNMNSWLHNVPALAKGRNRCTLLISPKDAVRFGLRDGEKASVRSRVGAVTAQVAVSDEMMPGVVSLPHGFGHTDPLTRLSVATTKQPGVNSNQLADELLLDEPSGASVTNGIPVEVSPA
jgi:anaerobic selenocysteine-containing dehydrogenase